MDWTLARGQPFSDLLRGIQCGSPHEPLVSRRACLALSNDHEGCTPRKLMILNVGFHTKCAISLLVSGLIQPAAHRKRRSSLVACNQQNNVSSTEAQLRFFGREVSIACIAPWVLLCGLARSWCAGQHSEIMMPGTYTYMQNLNAHPGILYLSGPRVVYNGCGYLKDPCRVHVNDSCRTG